MTDQNNPPMATNSPSQEKAGQAAELEAKKAPRHELNIPGDLKEEATLSKWAVLKSKGWKFWAGSLAALILVSGAVVAGLMGQGEFFRGTLEIDRLGGDLTIQVSKIDSQIPTEKFDFQQSMTYFPVDAEGNINTVYEITQNQLAESIPDIGKYDTYLHVFDQDAPQIKERHIFLSVDNIQDARVVAHNLEEGLMYSSDATWKTHHVQFIFVKEEPDGSYTDIQASKALKLNYYNQKDSFGINLNPEFADPVYSYQESREPAVTVQSDLSNFIHWSETLKEFLSEVRVVVYESGSNNVIAESSIGTDWEWIDFDNFVLNHRDLFSIHDIGGVDMDIKFEYDFKTDRNGFTCALDDPDCSEGKINAKLKEIPEFTLESNRISLRYDAPTDGWPVEEVPEELTCDNINISRTSPPPTTPLTVGDTSNYIYTIQSANETPVNFTVNTIPGTSEMRVSPSSGLLNDIPITINVEFTAVMPGSDRELETSFYFAEIPGCSYTKTETITVEEEPIEPPVDLCGNIEISWDDLSGINTIEEHAIFPRIKNNNTEAITISSFTLDNTSFYNDGTSLPIVLTPSGEETLDLGFNPSDYGTFNANMTIGLTSGCSKVFAVPAITIEEETLPETINCTDYKTETDLTELSSNIPETTSSTETFTNKYSYSDANTDRKNTTIRIMAEDGSTLTDSQYTLYIKESSLTEDLFTAAYAQAENSYTSTIDNPIEIGVAVTLNEGDDFAGTQLRINIDNDGSDCLRAGSFVQSTWVDPEEPEDPPTETNLCENVTITAPTAAASYEVGTTSTLAYSLNNTNTDAVNIGFALSDDSADTFSFIEGATSPFVLTTDGLLELNFAPTTEGTTSLDVEFTVNSGEDTECTIDVPAVNLLAEAGEDPVDPGAECPEAESAAIIEAFTDLNTADPNYQSQYNSALDEIVDALDTIENIDELNENCTLPAEPAACTNEQQNAMEAIFEAAELNNPNAADYEADFTAYLEDVAAYPADCDREVMVTCTEAEQVYVNTQFSELDPDSANIEEEYNTLVEVFTDHDTYSTCTIPTLAEATSGVAPEDMLTPEGDILRDTELGVLPDGTYPSGVPGSPGYGTVVDTRPSAPVYGAANVTQTGNIQGSTGPGLLLYPALAGIAGLLARRKEEEE